MAGRRPHLKNGWCQQLCDLELLQPSLVCQRGDGQDPFFFGYGWLPHFLRDIGEPRGVDTGAFSAISMEESPEKSRDSMVVG